MTRILEGTDISIRGLVREALTAIGKEFTGTTKTVATKAATAIAKKASQRVGEIAVEKGSKRIEYILRKRKSQISPDARQKLANILQPQAPREPFLSPTAAFELNRLLANELCSKIFSSS